MKYHSIMLAGAVAFSGLAGAADDNKSAVSKDEMADIHIQCLDKAFGEELEGDQKDAFVKDCVQQTLAKRKARDKNA
jgi:hypothetical protein